MEQPNTHALENLLKLIEERKHILDALNDLDNIDRMVNDEPCYNCDSVMFEAHGGKNFITHPTFDQDLVKELVSVAKKHYNSRIQTIDLLVGLSERAVHKVLTAAAAKLEEKVAEDNVMEERVMEKPIERPMNNGPERNPNGSF